MLSFSPSEQLAAIVWAMTYIVVLTTSGFWVRWLLGLAGQSIPADERNPGAVIGKLEDLLVVALVSVGEYTALAVVFGLKEIVRVQQSESSRDGQPSKASYYILGTLANFTWALGIALVVRWALERLL